MSDLPEVIAPPYWYENRRPLRDSVIRISVPVVDHRRDIRLARMKGQTEGALVAAGVAAFLAACAWLSG